MRGRFTWYVTLVDHDYWPVSDEHECLMSAVPHGRGVVAVEPAADLFIPVTQEGHVESAWLFFTDTSGKEMMRFPVNNQAPVYLTAGDIVSVEGAVKYTVK